MTTTTEDVVPQAAPEPQTGSPGPARRRWCRGTRLVFAAAVGWLTFCLAEAVLDGRFWLWLLPASVAPPPLFAVVPVVLALLSFVARPARLVILVLCVLSLLLSLDRVGVNVDALGGGGAVTPTAVHVFDWNTEFWDQDDDPDRFYTFLRAQHADVYLLQEYIGTDTVSNLDTRIDDLARVRREFPGYSVAIRGELITLSRFPIVDRPLVWPDERTADEDTPAGWQPYFERAKILRTDVLIAGRVVSFYNVHVPVQFDVTISPFSPSFYRTMAAKSANRDQQFQGLVRSLAADHNPFLVAGDFNTSPAMNDIRPVAAEGTDVAEADGPLIPVSWPAGGVTMWRVDWAFTDNGVKNLRYVLRDPQGLSDHRPQDMWIDVGGGQ